MSGVRVPDPEELPLDLLLILARREVEEDDAEAQVPFLVALHRRPTREVFDRAAALVNDSDATRRTLGARILRELGAEGADGLRPYAAEAVPLLLARLRVETDPGVLQWIVSALGYHHAGEALPDVLALTGHPDERVRFHIAAALPSLVTRSDVEPAAVEALIRLCHDDDADTRYYALYAVTREIEGIDTEVVARLTDGLRYDPDDQIATMAAGHHTAIGEVRQILNQALGPTGHDDLIGPILVALACEGDVADLRALVAEPGAAERLVTWWQARG